jgi:hypothetical protein
MRVLIACEFSGIVRDAFIERGHQAISCDLLETEKPGPHYIGDVLNILNVGWDLMIAHPPCTCLCNSGARWRFDHIISGDYRRSLNFVETLLNCDIPKIALENPMGVIPTEIKRKPDQVIQPWQFGHGETKATCLWLKWLPKLQPTNIVEGRENRVHRESPSKDRWKNRSRFFTGIAQAMAKQWGNT